MEWTTCMRAVEQWRRFYSDDDDFASCRWRSLIHFRYSSHSSGIEFTTCNLHVLWKKSISVNLEIFRSHIVIWYADVHILCSSSVQPFIPEISIFYSNLNIQCRMNSVFMMVKFSHDKFLMKFTKLFFTVSIFSLFCSQRPT